MNVRLFLPVLRPLISALMVWLTGQAGVELTDDQMTQATEQVVELVITLLSVGLGLYGVLANILKWPFYNRFGELQPGDVAPDTHELEAVKADAQRAHPADSGTIGLIRKRQPTADLPHDWKEGDPTGDDV